MSLKKVQLNLSQGEKKKGDEVADDDDVVRTSVTQDRVTATLGTEESFLSTQYIYCSSPHISERSTMRGGEDTDSHCDTFSGPSWVSHPLIGPHFSLQGF